MEKCRRLAGVLRRAAPPRLPSELLRLAYVSLVRSQLEYASGDFAPIASTHLNKLDTIQKIFARIATHQPRCAHSAPLIEHLQLESLSNRRSMHLKKLFSILTNESHPALHQLFQVNNEGCLVRAVVDDEATHRIGHRRFSIYAPTVFNAPQITE